MSEKLEIKREIHGDLAYLSLSGNITEDSQVEELLLDVKPKMVLDLKNIHRINSYGIRQWINVVKQVRSKCEQLVYFRCPPALVEQFNMINNFGGGGVVFSCYLPFYCEKCDREEAVLYNIPEGDPGSVPPGLDKYLCPACNEAMTFNDIEDEYFYFLQHQKDQVIDSHIRKFLADKK